MRHFSFIHVTEEKQYLPTRVDCVCRWKTRTISQISAPLSENDNGVHNGKLRERTMFAHVLVRLFCIASPALREIGLGVKIEKHGGCKSG